MTANHLTDAGETIAPTPRTDAMEKLSRATMNRADLAFDLARQLETELREMTEERDQNRKEVLAWLKENTTDGWISALRRERDKWRELCAEMRNILEPWVDRERNLIVKFNELKEGK